MPSAAPIRPASLVSTQQGVETSLRNDLTPFRKAYIFTTLRFVKTSALRLSRTKNLHSSYAQFPRFSAKESFVLRIKLACCVTITQAIIHVNRPSQGVSSAQVSSGLYSESGKYPDQRPVDCRLTSRVLLLHFWRCPGNTSDQGHVAHHLPEDPSHRHRATWQV